MEQSQVEAEQATEKHTPVVVGGTYKRPMGVGLWDEGVMLSSTKRGKKRNCIIDSQTHGRSVVVEDSSLDEWTLVAVPVPVEKMERIDALLARFDKVR